MSGWIRKRAIPSLSREMLTVSRLNEHTTSYLAAEAQGCVGTLFENPSEIYYNPMHFRCPLQCLSRLGSRSMANAGHKSGVLVSSWIP